MEQKTYTWEEEKLIMQLVLSLNHNDTIASCLAVQYAASQVDQLRELFGHPIVTSI